MPVKEGGGHFSLTKIRGMPAHIKTTPQIFWNMLLRWDFVKCGSQENIFKLYMQKNYCQCMYLLLVMKKIEWVENTHSAKVDLEQLKDVGTTACKSNVQKVTYFCAYAFFNKKLPNFIIFQLDQVLWFNRKNYVKRFQM